MTPWFLLLPILSALIGWLINSLASHFIFYPVKPIVILGIKIQGLIPAAKPLIAEKIAVLLTTELSNSSLLTQKLSSQENLQKVMPVVESHIDNFLRNKLQTALPMIAMFVGEKTIQQLKTVFMAELELIFPEVMQTYAKQLSNTSNISQLIRQKLDQYSVEQLNDTARSILAPHIGKLKLLGMITGFIIGLVQLLALYLFFSFNR